MINIKLYSENRRILQIAIPSIISNITVPLLGLIDVTIVGHLGSPAYIGAIAVGGMLFNIIYWIFGFLRMGTSGMTSQAYGQHDLNEITRLLLRSVGVGLSIAICLLILQYPILKLAFTMHVPSHITVCSLYLLRDFSCISRRPGPHKKRSEHREDS